MTHGSLEFIKVTDDKILDFMKLAEKKIIFAKPAFLKVELESLVDLSKKRNFVPTVYLEKGEDAIRLGFGETESLEVLLKNAEIIDLKLVNKLRLGILVVDDKSIVYMPELTFKYNESKEMNFPNGFFFNDDITIDIVKQLENDSQNIIVNNGDKESYDLFDLISNKQERQGNEDKIIEKNDSKIIVFPKVKISHDEKSIALKNIEESVNNLTHNPAIDPAKLSEVNFYRNNYKILKRKIHGIKITTRSINLKPFNTLLPKINERLESSWHIFNKTDIDEVQFTNIFEKELGKIDKKYKDDLYQVGRFGTLISSNILNQYKNEVNKFVEEFKEYLKHEDLPKHIKERFEKNNNEKYDRSKLIKIINSSRDELEKYLLSICPENDEDFRRVIFNLHYPLINSYKESNENEKLIFREFISFFVSAKLNFININKIIDDIKVEMDFYDISDELLFNNVDFIKSIQELEINVRSNFKGYK